tara:strand:- start:1009 stop:1500 length:492 start_codon:yes stop_codon:yes gene_type:complete
MILGRKGEDKRREAVDTASRAADAALAALARNDIDAARHELSASPKKLDFSDIGWKVALVQSLIDLKADKVKQGIQGLERVCARIDDTNLSRDDRGYLRLFCLYRATESTKDGRAPASLRAQAEDFRFDQTLISPELRVQLPLKVVEEKISAAPPKPSGMGDL